MTMTPMVWTILGVVTAFSVLVIFMVRNSEELKASKEPKSMET